MRFLIVSILTALLYIDMYQDRINENRTVIIIERDETIQTFTVDNSRLNDPNLIDELIGELNGGSKNKK